MNFSVTRIWSHNKATFDYISKDKRVDKVSIYSVLVVAFVSLLVIGFCLTTWKMFYFRNRMLEFIDNDRWEETLATNKVYDDNLIVFFGDSQINLWWTAPHFGALPVVNKGKSGDWTERAVRRFDRDVLALNPKILVMLIGTNDLEGGRKIETITKNIEIILKKASDHNIKIFICSLLPVRGEHLDIRPLSSIIQINQTLKAYSMKYDAEYVDFYSQMIDEYGLLNSDFTTDGLHPNRAGYMKMTKILLPDLLTNAVKFIK